MIILFLIRASPDKLLQDNVLHRLVTVLLNEQNQKKSDKVCFIVVKYIVVVFFLNWVLFSIRLPGH